MSKLFLTTTRTAISKKRIETIRRIVTVSRYPLVEEVVEPDAARTEPDEPPFKLILRSIFCPLALVKADPPVIMKGLWEGVSF